MWPSYLSRSRSSVALHILRFPVLVALALQPDLVATVHFEALPCQSVDRQDVLVPNPADLGWPVPMPRSDYPLTSATLSLDAK